MIATSTESEIREACLDSAYVTDGERFIVSLITSWPSSKAGTMNDAVAQTIKMIETEDVAFYVSDFEDPGAGRFILKSDADVR